MKGRQKSKGRAKPRERRSASREGRFLDLKGEVSSYALLACLLELEELKQGGVLEVQVDDERVSADLAKLLRDEGHTVVGIERVAPGVWTLDIEKGGR